MVNTCLPVGRVVREGRLNGDWWLVAGACYHQADIAAPRYAGQYFILILCKQNNSLSSQSVLVLYTIMFTAVTCPDGGIGRRAGLKNQWDFPLPVRFRLRVL